MIHGVCWGIGQSTLARRLAQAMPDADVLWEDELSQPAIFTRPEFAAVADRFRRHNMEPSAGIGHPPPDMLEEAYGRLVEMIVGTRRTALMAWSVMDLAEDLDWARTDERLLHEHARLTRDVFQPLRPTLVYLDGDVSVALKRAVDQRGRDWFGTAYGRDGECWDDLERRLAAEAIEGAGRGKRAFEIGGWFPAIDVDATTVDSETVYRVVAEELRRRNVCVNA